MLQRIIETINHCHSFLITAHVRLDGDALGSELALHQVLTSLGKEALIYNQDETPGNYLFLPGSGSIVHELNDPERFDAAVVLDCGELERIGGQAHRVREMKRIIMIDHHLANGCCSELTYIDAKASSTGELLYRLFVQMEIEPERDAANNLYAAILTDTGGFRYRNTGKDTLLAAGRLVGYGADPQWLSENIYENNPRGKIRLLAEALKTMSFDLDGRVASLIVDLDTIARTEALSEQTEGFVDIPRTIRGVEVSILYLELSRNHYKLSMRSKGSLNVEQVARMFGGGGHTNAAACQITGEIGDIRRRITDALRLIL